MGLQPPPGPAFTEEKMTIVVVNEEYCTIDIATCEQGLVKTAMLGI